MKVVKILNIKKYKGSKYNLIYTNYLLYVCNEK